MRTPTLDSRDISRVPYPWSILWLLSGGIGGIILGLFLTLTIIGAPVGLPMAAAGVGLILLSPFPVLYRSVCPACLSKINFVRGTKRVRKCRKCKRRHRVDFEENAVFLVP